MGALMSAEEQAAALACMSPADRAAAPESMSARDTEMGNQQKKKDSTQEEKEDSFGGLGHIFASIQEIGAERDQLAVTDSIDALNNEYTDHESNMLERKAELDMMAIALENRRK